MFKKWVDIENHYHSKFITRFFDFAYHEIIEQTFLVTEKLDGANFSIIFDQFGNRSYAKRSSRIPDDAQFFNYPEIFEEEGLEDFLEEISRSCKLFKKSYQFTGEIFGPRINGRVDYGPKKRWRWFAINEIDDEGNSTLLTTHQAWNLVCTMDILSLYGEVRFFVPILTEFEIDSKADFLAFFENFDIHYNSQLAGIDGNRSALMEGVVVRPIMKDFVSPVGSLFILKFKNPEFRDGTMEKKNREKKIVVHSEEATNIVSDLTEYVNHNRSIDLFSKHGEIQEPSEIGKYIKLYYEDIVHDYEKSHDIVIKKHEDKSHINKRINRAIVAELQRFL
jgi:Rnl2 family RNA ligase